MLANIQPWFDHKLVDVFGGGLGLDVRTEGELEDALGKAAPTDGLVVGHALAWELVQTFLVARFSGAERHRRRLAKVAELENTPPKETP